MGIDLQWEGERGNVLEHISDEQGLVAQILAAAEEEGSVCLRFVDPYGDTVFNQQQIRVFLEEVRAVPAEHLSADAKSHLRRSLSWRRELRPKFTPILSSMATKEPIQLTEPCR